MAGADIIPKDFVDLNFWMQMPRKFNSKKSEIQPSENEEETMKRPHITHLECPTPKKKVFFFFSIRDNQKNVFSQKKVEDPTPTTRDKDDDDDDFVEPPTELLPNFEKRNINCFMDVLKENRVTVAMKRMKGYVFFQS